MLCNLDRPSFSWTKRKKNSSTAMPVFSGRYTRLFALHFFLIALAGWCFFMHEFLSKKDTPSREHRVLVFYYCLRSMIPFL